MKHFLLSLTLLLTSAVQGEVVPSVHLEKTAAQEWFVTYKYSAGMTQLGFTRNPNKARIARWQSLDPQIEIVYSNGKEYIKRKDNKLFKKVTFALTPHYTSLPKDYAPFSRFSDGGVLVHDGRFQVCIDECRTDKSYIWDYHIKIPARDLLLVHGEVKRNSHSWQVEGNGTLIYVGERKPKISNSMLALIDPQLPKKLLNALNESLPQFMSFFATKLGELPKPPHLFASFEKVAGQSNYQQGGTLPGQVFVHWVAPNLDKYIADPEAILNLNWFFAHEAAHVYQKGGHNLFNNESAWIHEGGAELLAYFAMKNLVPDSKVYLSKKIGQFISKCRSDVAKNSLKNASEQGVFKAHYNCGFLLHLATKNLLDKKNPDLYYKLWNRYRESVLAGKAPGQETFLALIKEETSSAHHQLLINFIDETAKYLPDVVKLAKK